MAMPLGHGSEQQRLRPLARREKLMAASIGGVLAIVLVAVVVISLTHADKRSGHGCIAVSLAYSMGGTQTYRCGVAARAMCSAVNKPGLEGTAGRDVAQACRKAGVPVD
jgi:hypothetical protein